MTLRIGMILDNDFPPDSRVENEAISLINAGFEVYLFSISYKGLTGEEDINGIKVIRYPSSRITYKLSALAYTLPVYHNIVSKDIRDFLSTYGIQVIHIHDIQVARAVWNANKHKLPMVLDLHENRPEIMKSYRHVNTLSGRLLINPDVWEKYQNVYIGEADKVIVVTTQAKEVIVKDRLKEGEDILVVPNTVSEEIFLNYSIDEKIISRFSGSFNILYLGDTGLRRGTDNAIEALSILVNKIENIQLILVGSNKEDNILKKIVRKNKLENSVVFEGWQDVSLFPSYVSVADICISPLKRNKHHDTTFANKIFQYMAMGKPLVVSDCPPQAEVVEDAKAGLVHEAENVNDLAEKIFELHSNNEMREEMGKNAMEAVLKRWNWKETSKDLIGLYTSFKERSW